MSRMKEKTMKKSSIRCRGKQYEVVDAVRLSGRNYEVVRRLGNRGRIRMQVYDRSVDDMRVIQVVPSSTHFKQTLRVLRKCSGLRGFPQILDVGRAGKMMHVLTDWTWGMSLAEYLRRAKSGGKPWPSAHQAWVLYSGLIHSLSHFHDITMCVHGDIKPENLIVQKQPQRLRMIDFGSAWSEHRSLQRTPGDGHSLGYAAPELHADGRGTFLSDQFSVSVVLYEMLTGKLPYSGLGGRAGWPKNVETFRETFVKPSTCCKGDRSLPMGAWKVIDEVVATGLALDPNERHVTSNKLRDAVDEATQTLRSGLQRPRWHESILASFDWMVGIGQKYRSKMQSKH